jgi:hypothetical protein
VLADLATPKAGHGRVTAKSDNRLRIPNIDETLAANGVARLLPVLPFGTQTVARLQEFALIATLLETVRRTLKLDLATATPDQLAHSLERISSSVRLPASPLSRPEAAAVAEFARITPAAISLRKIGIDIFAKNGAHDLEHWMASPVTGAALAQLGQRPIASATLQNLARLASISLSTPSTQRTRGQDRPTAASAIGCTAAGGPCIERLATLLPVIESAKLLRPAMIDEHNAEFAALKVVEKTTGLAPDDAATGPRISELMARLKGGGLCQAAQAASLSPAQLEGLARLQRFAACRESIRSSAKVDVLDHDASGKLARAVEEMRHAARVTSTHPSESPAVLAALSHLAVLGTALSAVQPVRPRTLLRRSGASHR